MALFGEGEGRILRWEAVWRKFHGAGDEKQEGHGCIEWEDLFSQGPLGGTLAVEAPLLEPFKRGYIPNKYPLYKVNMGLIIKGTIPRVFPPFSLWQNSVFHQQLGWFFQEQ